MNRSSFCAYGAKQTVAALEPFEEAGTALVSTLAQSGTILPQERVEPLLHQVEQARRAAVRLQACLTLFAPCFPPTRIAFWKRRLRRLMRALNAMEDHLRLVALIPPRSRLRLRLQQHLEKFVEKAQQAWERLHREHIPNEIRGLASPHPNGERGFNDQVKEYARVRWRELARMNLGRESGKVGIQSPLLPNNYPIEVRWGRLQLMKEVAEMLVPLLNEEIPLEALRARSRELSNQRFRARAAAILQQLKAEERRLVLHYQGHLRGFKRIEREFDQWIEQFQLHLSERSDLIERSSEAGGL